MRPAWIPFRTWGDGQGPEEQAILTPDMVSKNYMRMCMEKLLHDLTSSSFPDSIASNHLSSSLDVPLSLPLPFFLFASVFGEDPTCPDLSSALAGEPFSFDLSLELDGPALENTSHTLSSNLHAEYRSWWWHILQ